MQFSVSNEAVDYIRRRFLNAHKSPREIFREDVKARLSEWYSAELDKIAFESITDAIRR